MVVCLLVMHQAARQLCRNPVTIKSIKPADKELIGFVLAKSVCVLPSRTSFAGFDMGD